MLCGEATELDLRDFLGRAWGMRVNSPIAAYNDMTKVGGSMLLGLEAFVPRNAPIPPGHSVVDVGYGQVESGGWYLVRRPDGHYDLHRIDAAFTQPLQRAFVRRAQRPSRRPGLLGESHRLQALQPPACGPSFWLAARFHLT